jgi:hypothetical protein
MALKEYGMIQIEPLRGEFSRFQSSWNVAHWHMIQIAFQGTSATVAPGGNTIYTSFDWMLLFEFQRFLERPMNVRFRQLLTDTML